MNIGFCAVRARLVLTEIVKSLATARPHRLMDLADLLSPNLVDSPGLSFDHVHTEVLEVPQHLENLRTNVVPLLLGEVGLHLLLKRSEQSSHSPPPPDVHEVVSEAVVGLFHGHDDSPGDSPGVRNGR